MKFTRNNVEEVKLSAEPVVPTKTIEDDVKLTTAVDVQVKQLSEEVLMRSDLEERFAIPAFESSIKKDNLVQDTVVESVVDTVEPSLTETGVESDGTVCLIDAVSATEAVTTAQNLVDPNNDDLVYRGQTFIPVDEKVEEIVVESVEVTPESICKSDEVTESEIADTQNELNGESQKDLTEGLSNEAWNKFVDNVIVPTLVTCTEKTIEYIKTVLSNDLKNLKPDVK